MKRFLGAILLSAALFSAPASGKTSDASWAPSPGDVIEFDVLRKGEPFGSHSVKFGQDSQGRLTATTDVNLKAGLGLSPFSSMSSTPLKCGRMDNSCLSPVRLTMMAMKGR